MKKYGDLRGSERCIYQAFTQAESATPEAMGELVNAAGYDADDGRAVLVLAKQYGFGKVEAYTGAFFLDEVRHERNVELIAVITRNRLPSSLFPDIWNAGGGSADRLLTDKRLDNVEWHAIYGRADGAGRVTWHDEQNLWRNGPVRGDYLLCWTREP
ncbi:MAG TPA: hypothetical protein VF746_12640 [Longimicrobium sp.]|jgi:hypothetical protein